MVDVTLDFDFIECEDDNPITSQSPNIHQAKTPTTNQSQPLTTNTIDWSRYTPKMLRTPVHNAFRPAVDKTILLPTISESTPTTSSIASTSAKIKQSLSFSESSVAPNKTAWTSRRRPSLQNPPVSEVNLKFENLAEAKLALVRLQIELLNEEEKRKKARDEEDSKTRKAREEEELARRLDDYKRKVERENNEEARKKETHKMEIKILEEDLNIKQKQKTMMNAD